MSFALVLDGGGITGAAWEAGILKGLFEVGIDLTEASAVIGSSAGAIVGAAITTAGLDAYWQRQLGPVDTTVERPTIVTVGTINGALRAAGMSAPGKTSEEVLAKLGRLAIEAEVEFTEAERLSTIAARIGSNTWPDRDLSVTAIDCETGVLTVWKKSSGVSLIAAVASSCAAPFVYPPATINGRRYMDGGVRFGANADLASGHEHVVVITPVARFPFARIPLEANIEALRAGGSSVALIEEDALAAEVISQGPMDPDRRRPAAEAGLAQAARVAPTLPDWTLQMASRPRGKP